MHIINVDGSVISSECAAYPGSRMMRDIVRGDIEFVRVLYQGKVTRMIVNENGAMGPRPLRPNARATAIYWTATCTGQTPAPFEPLTDPMVHGIAVLFEDVSID